MEWTLRKMSREELKALYPIMRQDFPKEELKPCARLLELMDRGCYDVMFLLEGEARRGYAAVLRTEGSPFVLLDYLAMFQKGAGGGSKCLKLLQEAYPHGILAETEAESPEMPGEVNALRRRRFAFYRRAGFAPCPFENDIFGVRYLVHLWCPRPLEEPEREAALALYESYRSQMKPESFRRWVHITPPEALPDMKNNG